jgi:hypothetical protein
MSRYAPRLTRLARQLGCPTHEAPLTCPACEVPPPLPADLSTMMDALADTIVTRIGREALRAVCLRVPLPPIFDACARCGRGRKCGACQADHTQALLQAIGLTADEQTMVERALAACRARDREWR